MVSYKRLWLIVMLLGACSPDSLIKPAEAQVAAGRYAVPWKSYHGSYVDEPAPIHLAFIDVYPDGPAPQHHFGKAHLLTDQGAIPLTANPRLPSSSTPSYELFSVAFDLPTLTPGRYQARQLQYEDQQGRTQTLTIGEWLIEIREKPAKDMLSSQPDTTGAAGFGSIQVHLENRSTEPITVHDLSFPVPGDVATTTISPALEMSQHSFFDTGSIANNSITLEPGTSQSEDFTVLLQHSAKAHSFISVKPFVAYTISSDPTLHYYPLYSFIHVSEFEKSDLITFLESIPADAYHPF